MKFKILSLLLLAILIDCSESKPSEEQIANEGYENSEEFFTSSKKSLEDDYYKLWDFASDKIDTVNLTLLSSKTYQFKGDKIFSIRVAGQSTEPWSYSEKVLIGKSNGEIALDMDFIQIEPELKIPECGVPNYFVDSLTTITIGNHELFAVGYTAKFEACCGQSEEQRTELMIYTDSQKVELIELFYWNAYNGTCIEEKPEETRKSTIRTSGNSLIVERTTKIKGQESTTETFKYLYDGKSLRRK